MDDINLSQIYNDFFIYQRVLKSAEQEYFPYTTMKNMTADQKGRATYLKAVIQDAKEEIAAIQKILRRIS